MGLHILLIDSVLHFVALPVPDFFLAARPGIGTQTMLFPIDEPPLVLVPVFVEQNSCPVLLAIFELTCVSVALVVDEFSFTGCNPVFERPVVARPI